MNLISTDFLKIRFEINTSSHQAYSFVRFLLRLLFVFFSLLLMVNFVRFMWLFSSFVVILLSLVFRFYRLCKNSQHSFGSKQQVLPSTCGWTSAWASCCFVFVSGGFWICTGSYPPLTIASEGAGIVAEGSWFTLRSSAFLCCSPCWAKCWSSCFSSIGWAGSSSSGIASCPTKFGLILGGENFGD